ncbi:MAG: hypothetical protein KBS53_03090, partial [Bacteroidales bacterium]|nr:hypothetical protein [Candidatus Hennigimonas equi]
LTQKSAIRCRIYIAEMCGMLNFRKLLQKNLLFTSKGSETGIFTLKAEAEIISGLHFREGYSIAMEFRTQSDFNPNTLFCYADCKYSVQNKSNSPYIRGRLGMSYGNSSEYVGICAMPECGFDFGKFSAGLAAIWDSQLRTDSGIRLQLGVSYRF